MSKTWAAVRGNNSIAEIKTQDDLPQGDEQIWKEAPAEAQPTPADRTPEPGEWGWNPGRDNSDGTFGAVEIIVAPTADEQRPSVLAALHTEYIRALTEDGVTFMNAAGTAARYSLGLVDQQNITATAVNGDPSFTGVTKTSLDKGEVVLTAQDCHALAVVARARVIVIVDWYKAQKAAVEASADPASLLPFVAPAET